MRGHEWALRELTRNLLHNAIKHAPEGSPLSLRLSAEGNTAVLTVGDAGGGISEAQRQRLFQPFSPGSPPGTGHGGAGLGLAICADIADSLGGQISLDNRLRGGRVVGLDAQVRLPLADNGGR